MIYRSNLTAPDLMPHFKHVVSSPMPHSFGHDVPRGWADKPDVEPWKHWKRCGWWTHDEAAILFNVVVASWPVSNKDRHSFGLWADIGANLGWTTAHIAVAGAEVFAVEPMQTVELWEERFQENCYECRQSIIAMHWKSERFWAETNMHLDGCVIDGDHDAPQPLLDAQGAAKHEARVILFHDFIGRPVREGVEWLMQHGYSFRVYLTPHMVACCWRHDSGFTPPDHVPDPNLPDLRARCPEFDWSKTV
jgi:hypothetical protein